MIPAKPPVPEPVNYQRPATLQRVLREFAVVDTLGGAAITLKVLVGLPLSLVGPLFITMLAKAIEARWNANVLPGFGAMFWLVSFVLVPLLLWYERRTSGEFFSDAVRGESSPLTASSYGEYEMQSTKMLWIGYAEIALTGPRLLWEAIDALRGRSRLDPASRDVAAEIVTDLFDAGEGLPVRSLFRQGRSPKDVGRAVDYLAKRDWVGLAKSRDRIWLSSQARERMTRV